MVTSVPTPEQIADAKAAHAAHIFARTPYADRLQRGLADTLKDVEWYRTRRQVRLLAARKFDTDDRTFWRDLADDALRGEIRAYEYAAEIMADLASELVSQLRNADTIDGLES